MIKKTTGFPVAEIPVIKQKMLRWANRHNIFCFLDNSDYSIQPHRYDCLLATAPVAEHHISLSTLDSFLEPGEWYFGHLSYEAIGANDSNAPSVAGFPSFSFFRPSIVISLSAEVLLITASDPEKIYASILEEHAEETTPPFHIELVQEFSREGYLKVLGHLLDHIHRGDCYEINFCQQFFARKAELDPVTLYQRLWQASPNPFSALYKREDSYLVCASPERFLMKQGQELISQPMKGTMARDAENKTHDEALKKMLASSAKDKAENVMVVDMVRNDLARVCVEGSVQVDELYGVYSYPKVHQMISTIRGTLQKNISFTRILEACFPMGSMTGAPKPKVMELIRKYETSPRGLFSGSIGYIDPEANFDFNVVIRSILYDAREKYLSYKVGSGITVYSDPEKEWEECMLKGEAIKKVLTG